MIPTRTSRPFGRVSPRVSDTDLARLIERTIEMRVKAKREQGFAAFSTGCDGRRRTTMFDGSVCQAEGEVCIATRQDGISACIEAPTQGNGLTTQGITFTNAVCAPATGWWIVDEKGYMYRVPQSLIDAAPYWPMSADPHTFDSYTLLRSGTWAKLMCGAALVIPLNGDGGAKWIRVGEAGWGQLFTTAIGGVRSRWTILPTLSVTAGGFSVQVDVIGGAVVIDGEALTFGGTQSVYFYEYDGAGALLDPGNEYGVAAWVDALGIGFVAGAQGLIGTVTPPDLPDGRVPAFTALIREGFTGSTATLTASLTALYGEGFVPLSTFPHDVDSWRGVLLRDAMAPNAGSRVATVTLPAAGIGIVTGAVRVAYGYPFGCETFDPTPSSLAPYSRTYTSTPPGTWQTDCAGRVAGDMALAYRRGLAVEYGAGHVNLAGPDITDAGDYVSVDEIDLSSGPPQDVAADVIGMPGAEVVLLGATGAGRYRVRAAPNTAPTVALIRQPKGAWGFDPNVFVEETDYAVYPWADGATSFQIAEDLTAPEAPGRGVPVVLWEKPSGVDNYLDSPHAYYGSLGQTSGGLTEIAFGLGVVIAASSASTLRLTVIGPRLISAYGWTAEDDAGNETALSPLVLVEASLELPPYQPLYTPEITVPGGPDGTALRHVYRFTWDFGSTGVTAGPWAYLWGDGGWFGGLYDRMMRRIATYDSTEPLAVAGTDPVTIYDEDVSLTTYGTRPPSPLIYTGTITVDSPSPVYLLPPLNL